MNFSKYLLLLFSVLNILMGCDVMDPTSDLETTADTTDTSGNSGGKRELHAPVLSAPSNGAWNLSSAPTLSWKEVSGADTYQVHLSNNNSFDSHLVDEKVTGLQYKVEGLAYDSTWFWKVRALSADSVTGPWSEVRTFATAANSETVSTALLSPADSSTGQPTGLELKWDEVQQANSYRLQLATNPDLSDARVDTSVAATSLSVDGLSADYTYYWRVKPEIDSGNGNWSEVWNFTTATDTGDGSDTGSSDSDMWVGAYLASWNHYVAPSGNWGNMKTEDIDWDAFTHLFYFALNAKADGSLSDIAPYQNMSPDRINAIVSAAHQHEKRVLITIGGWGNHDGFSNAISPAVRPVFIANLVALIETWGFDGIDLDMEPINGSDSENYIAFVRELHAALQAIDTPLESRPLLTAATAWRPDIFSQLQDYFDQINLMTYDYSGAWQGWVSWHNAAVYDGGLTFPGSTKSLPSIDGTVKRFIAEGVPASKLGIGIDFYGYVWEGGNGTPTGGITAPNQSWSTAPKVTDNVPYHEIMDKYYPNGKYVWDRSAEAAYLSVDTDSDATDLFVSYDNEKSIESKIRYIREKKLGGTIIWELTGGFRKSQPAGSRDKLLQAVRKEVWQ